MIYFKNPEIKVHYEEWGSVVDTISGVVLLTNEETSLFNNFVETEIVDPTKIDANLKRLIELELILSISKKDSEKIKNNQLKG